MSEMLKRWGGGVTDFLFEKERVENYPNFDKSILVYTGPALGLQREQDVLRGKIIVFMEESQNT